MVSEADLGDWFPAYDPETYSKGLVLSQHVNGNLAGFLSNLVRVCSSSAFYGGVIRSRPCSRLLLPTSAPLVPVVHQPFAPRQGSPPLPKDSRVLSSSFVVEDDVKVAVVKACLPGMRLAVRTLSRQWWWRCDVADEWWFHAETAERGDSLREMKQGAIQIRC